MTQAQAFAKARQMMRNDADPKSIIRVLKNNQPLEQMEIDGHVIRVGDGGTVNLYSDRHAATVIKLTPKEIHLQQDNAKRIDNRGMSDWQEYEYTPNPNGHIYIFKLLKRGWTCKEARGLGLTFRKEYHDFSF